MNKNQKIAVSVGLALLAYLLFGNSFISLFNNNQVDSRGDTLAEAERNGFVVEDVVVGDGQIAELGNTVTVHYVGTLTDGRVFDSSIDRNSPFSFTLGQGAVIRGWDEGLIGMRAGGKRVLVISPEFAYGAEGAGPIPPNSTLIFEVELLEIN